MTNAKFYEKMMNESIKSLIMYAIASHTIKTIDDVLNVCPSVEKKLGERILNKMFKDNEIIYNSDMVMQFPLSGE